MGFSLKKLVKKVVNVHKKIFKATKKVAKKLWENKYTRAALIAGAVIAGGYALAAYSGAGSGAAAAGVSGGASATGASAATTTAGTLGATGTAASGGAAAGSAGSAFAGASPLATFQASMAPTAAASGGAASTAGASTGLLAKAGAGLSKVGTAIAANPTITTIGGLGLMNAAQARSAEKQAEEEREYQERLRNEATAYGVSYDGKTDVNINSGQKLMDMNQHYRQGMIDPNAPAGSGLLRRDPYKANGVS